MFGKPAQPEIGLCGAARRLEHRTSLDEVDREPLGEDLGIGTTSLEKLTSERFKL